MTDTKTAAPEGVSEIDIFVRMLIGGDGTLTPDFARYLLDLKLSERDQARMHSLAVRNQNDDLSPAERAEMHAFAKAGTMISILKSKARRMLGVKLNLSAEA